MVKTNLRVDEDNNVEFIQPLATKLPSPKPVSHPSPSSQKSNTQTSKNPLSSRKRKSENPIEVDVESENDIPHDEETKDENVEEGDEVNQDDFGGKVVRGWAIDAKWCKSSKFTQLLELIEFQGWEFLFYDCYAHAMSQSSVLSLFGSLSHVQNSLIGATNNKVIILNSETLASHFKLNLEGYDYYAKQNVEIDFGEGSMNEKIVEYFGGTEGSSKVELCDMSAFGKVLFYIVRKSVLPRPHGRGGATLLDLAYMYCLATKRKINFASLMMKHLTYVHSNKHIPGYGALLTFLIAKQNQIPKKTLTVPRVTDYLNGNTLATLRMKIVNGEVKYIAEVDEPPVEETPRGRKSSRIAAKSVSQPPPAPTKPIGTSSGHSGFAPFSVAGLETLVAQAIEQIGEVSVQLMRIEGTMKKRLDEIEDKVDDLNEEMSSLKEKVTKLMEEVVTEEEVPEDPPSTP